MKAVKPSPEQAEVLKRILSSGSIERWPGGFWTTPGQSFVLRYHPAVEIPAWSTTLQTVQAMEKRGWLVRVHKYADAWRDDRVLTALGVEAAKP